MTPQWRKLSLWRLTLCLSNNTLEWWHDPRMKRLCLRSRAGSTFDFRYTPGAYFIRRRLTID